MYAIKVRVSVHCDVGLAVSLSFKLRHRWGRATVSSKAYTHWDEPWNTSQRADMVSLCTRRIPHSTNITYIVADNQLRVSPHLCHSLAQHSEGNASAAKLNT